MLSGGGEVWVGDETTLREFPPLRAAWAKRGQQATVISSGRNARRVVHGMLNVTTGELEQVVRERGRGEDVEVAVRALGARRPQVPKRLIRDNAPPHPTDRARPAAADARIALVWLPFRSPDLNPGADVWRQLKAVVAAHRAYPSVDDLAARATTWLDELTATDVRRFARLPSSKFDWLPT